MKRSQSILGAIATLVPCAGTAVAEEPADPGGAERSALPSQATATNPSPPETPVATRKQAVRTSAGVATPIAQSAQQDSAAKIETTRTKLVVEFGLLDPLAHRIQFGRNGTAFNYVKDGGQDVLFPTTRLSVEAFWRRRHGLIFLYQPIDIRTDETLRQDLIVDNVTFPAGTAMKFRYGFDFYRVSYLFNFLSCQEENELSLGGSLQLRNAIIDFTSVDGTLSRSNRDVGPVPAIKSRGRWHVSERAWLGYEADGMYAPVKYINGGKSDVVGAILDLSLRAGYNVAPPIDVFFNLRYLGGGATGTSKSDAVRGPGDGYTSNWLHFLTSTVGVEVRLERLFKH